MPVIEVVPLGVWHILRANLLFTELRPTEVLKPRVVHELLNTAHVTNSLMRVAFEAAVDEVGGLNGPPFQDLVFLYLNLMGD